MLATKYRYNNMTRYASNIKPPAAQASDQTNSQSSSPVQQGDAKTAVIDEAATSSTPTSSQTSTPTSTSQPQCLFLQKLPAELRNEIYRLVLVENSDDHPVQNLSRLYDNASPTLDPPLLKTCRQIREETSTIFWQENMFFIEILNCDVSGLIRWLNMAQSHKNAPLTILLRFKTHYANLLGSGRSGRWANPWDNLLLWVQAYLQGRCHRLGPKRGSQVIFGPVSSGSRTSMLLQLHGAVSDWRPAPKTIAGAYKDVRSVFNLAEALLLAKASGLLAQWEIDRRILDHYLKMGKDDGSASL